MEQLLLLVKIIITIALLALVSTLLQMCDALINTEAKKASINTEKAGDQRPSTLFSLEMLVT
jgi:hypothetical protein